MTASARFEKVEEVLRDVDTDSSHDCWLCPEHLDKIRLAVAEEVERTQRDHGVFCVRAHDKGIAQGRREMAMEAYRRAEHLRSAMERTQFRRWLESQARENTT